MPTLIKMAAVVRGSNQEWDGMEELPLEVPLPAGLRYHSMFSCPVTRESRWVVVVAVVVAVCSCQLVQYTVGFCEPTAVE